MPSEGALLFAALLLHLFLDTGVFAVPTVVGHVNGLYMPGNIALSGDGRYCYVPLFYSGAITTVDVSDRSNPKVVGQTVTDMDNLKYPIQAAVTADGKYLVAVARSSESVVVFDLNENATHPPFVGAVSSSTALRSARQLALSPDAQYAYVMGTDGQYLTAVDIGTDPSAPKVVGTLVSDELSQTEGIAVAPDGRYCCVTNFGSDSLAVIDVTDPSQPKVVGTVEGLHHATYVAMSNDGQHCFVTGLNSGSIFVVDVGTDPTTPTVVGVTTDTDQLYRADYIAMSPAGDYIVVSAGTFDESWLTVLDVHSNVTSPSVLSTSVTDNEALFETGSLVFSNDGRYAFVTGYQGSTLAVVDLFANDDNMTTSAARTTTTGASTQTAALTKKRSVTKQPPGKPTVATTETTTTTTTETTAQQSQSKQCSCKTGYDQEGHTIYAEDGVASAEDCCALCAVYDMCDCAVLASDINNGHCMLKNDCTMSYVGGTARTMCMKAPPAASDADDSVSCSWWSCTS